MEARFDRGITEQQRVQSTMVRAHTPASCNSQSLVQRRSTKTSIFYAQQSPVTWKICRRQEAMLEAGTNSNLFQVTLGIPSIFDLATKSTLAVTELINIRLLDRFFHLNGLSLLWLHAALPQSPSASVRLGRQEYVHAAQVNKLNTYDSIDLSLQGWMGRIQTITEKAEASCTLGGPSLGQYHVKPYPENCMTD